MKKGILCSLALISMLNAKCNIVRYDEDSTHYIYDLSCKSIIGDYENKNTTKENIIHEAKVKLSEKLNSIIISSVKTEKMNNIENGFVDHNIEVITPALNNVNVVHEEITNQIMNVELSIRVVKKFVTDYKNKLNTEAKVTTPLLPQQSNSAIKNEIMAKEQQRLNAEERANKTAKFSEKVSNNIINGTLMNNINITKNVIRTYTHNDFRAWSAMKDKGSSSVFAEVKTSIIINKDNFNTINESDSLSSLPKRRSLFTETEQILGNNSEFIRSSYCRDGISGSFISVDAVLEFENTGKKQIIYLPIKNCSNIEITEYIRDAREYQPVRLLRFEIHKSIDERASMAVEEAKLNYINERELEEQKRIEDENKMYQGHVRRVISDVWNKIDFGPTDKNNILEQRCTIQFTINRQGLAKYEIISITENEFYKAKVQEFLTKIQKKHFPVNFVNSQAEYFEMQVFFSLLQ